MNILTNLIIAYFIIALVLAIVKGKPDKTIIPCGIFGFCGTVNLSKVGWTAVLSNIKILGIYNDDRGGDNTGILLNNEITHSEGFIYKFGELIEKKDLENPDSSISTVILGHSRKGSVGGKTHKNAHPFPIYRSDKDADFYMAGVHNGTISNWKELAKNYAIDDKQIDNDSLTLLTILSRQKNLKRNKPVFRVLEQYEGYGAFAWYFPEEPNVLYVFKGASRRYKHEKELTEERPLFYYECPLTKGVYISSVEKGLKAISSNKDAIHEVPSNIVFKIINGKFVNSESVIIDRENIVEWFPSHSTNNSRNYSAYEETDDNIYGYGHGHSFAKNNASRMLPESPEKTSIVKEIFTRSSEVKKTEEKAQMAISFGETRALSVEYSSQVFDIPQKSMKTLENNSEVYRLEGLYYLNNNILDGIYIIEKKTFKAFNSEDSKVQLLIKQNPHDYDVRYFFEGYILKDIASYNYLTDLRIKDSAWKADKMDGFVSKFCAMPVPGFARKPSTFYIAGVKANMILTNPIYSHGYVYEYVNGKLISVKIPKKATENKLIVDIAEIRKQATNLGIPIMRTKEKTKNIADSVIDPEEKINLEDKIMEIPIDIKYLIDSQEEEIVELFNTLQEKCKEQSDIMSSYVKKGIIQQEDFMSGIVSGWFGDTIKECLLNPSNVEKKSPYFDEERGELVYKGLSKNYTLDLNLF